MRGCVALNVQAKRRCGPPRLNDSFLVAGRNGASSIHLAKHCSNVAYPVSERRFAVCYATVRRRQQS